MGCGRHSCISITASSTSSCEKDHNQTSSRDNLGCANREHFAALVSKLQAWMGPDEPITTAVKCERRGVDEACAFNFANLICNYKISRKVLPDRLHFRSCPVWRRKVLGAWLPPPPRPPARRRAEEQHQTHPPRHRSRNALRPKVAASQLAQLSITDIRGCRASR